jgi:metallothiol transferase
MIKKIFAVWIYVKDLAISRDFYENVLNLKFKFQDKDWVEYDLGDTTFALLQRPPTKGMLKPQKTHIMFQVENIEFCLKQLTNHNVEIIGNIRHEPFGQLLTLVDPNGHWLELFAPTKCNCQNQTKINP